MPLRPPRPKNALAEPSQFALPPPWRRLPPHAATVLQPKRPFGWSAAPRPPHAATVVQKRTSTPLAIQRMEAAPVASSIPGDKRPWQGKGGLAFSTIGHGSTGEILKITFTDGTAAMALKTARVVDPPRVLESDLHRAVARGDRPFMLRLVSGFVDDRLMPAKVKDFREAVATLAGRFPDSFFKDGDKAKALEALAVLDVDITHPDAQGTGSALKAWASTFVVNEKLGTRLKPEIWDYLVMEAVTGGTLRGRFRTAAAFKDLLRTLVQAVIGLGTAYAEIGLIHNDFHPSNILIREHASATAVLRFGSYTVKLPETTCEPVISDFGYSLLIQTEHSRGAFAEEYWRSCGSARVASSMAELGDLAGVVAASATHDMHTMGKTMDGTIGDQSLHAELLAEQDTKVLVEIFKGAESALDVVLKIGARWPGLVEVST
jgi:hypothetical protein